MRHGKDFVSSLETLPEFVQPLCNFHLNALISLVYECTCYSPNTVPTAGFAPFACDTGKLLGTHGYLLRLTEEFALGPGGQGLWRRDEESGQGCIPWLPPGEHVSLKSRAKPNNFCVSPLPSVNGWLRMCLPLWAGLYWRQQSIISVIHLSSVPAAEVWLAWLRNPELIK